MAVTQATLAPTRVKIVEPHTLRGRVNKLSEQIACRAYEIFEGSGKTHGHDLEDWFEAESEILQPFDLRIKEKEDSLIVEAVAPGFSAKEMEVSLEPWRLTISGKKEAKEEHKEDKSVYQEQSYEQLLRVIDLPAQIDSAKAAATLRNGVLEITVSKVVKPQRVEVKVA